MSYYYLCSTCNKQIESRNFTHIRSTEHLYHLIKAGKDINLKPTYKKYLDHSWLPNLLTIYEKD